MKRNKAINQETNKEVPHCTGFSCVACEGGDVQLTDVLQEVLLLREQNKNLEVCRLVKF